MPDTMEQDVAVLEQETDVAESPVIDQENVVDGNFF